MWDIVATKINLKVINMVNKRIIVTNINPLIRIITSLKINNNKDIKIEEPKKVILNIQTGNINDLPINKGRHKSSLKIKARKYQECKNQFLSQSKMNQ